MDSHFIALDVETANHNLESICQIGIVRYNNGHCTDLMDTLVNPQSHFETMHSAIHGISAEHVKDAPVFADIAEQVASLIDGNFVVAHGNFDKSSILKAFRAAHISPPVCTWVDTSRMARNAWPGELQSYSLKNVSDMLGFEFCHHNAISDARASGYIAYCAISHTGNPLGSFAPSQTKSARYPTSFKLAGNADGVLHGNVIVFTGSLSMSRGEAAEKAAQAGCDVAPNVTKKTTLLVVGDQDLDRIKTGETKSTKHIKAETLRAQGQPIRILTESDFLSMIE